MLALALGWMGLVPQGFGDLLPGLQEVQDQAEEEYHRQLADGMTNPLPADWILRNVSIVEVDSGELSKGQMSSGT